MTKTIAKATTEDAMSPEAQLVALGVDLDEIGGNCPVQAEGTVDGYGFYFRARGSHWSLSIGSQPVGDPEWCYSEIYGEGDHAAGWMSQDEALAAIARAVRLWRDGHPGRG